MHLMAYHVPQQMRQLNGIKQFSGQGMCTLFLDHDTHRKIPCTGIYLFLNNDCFILHTVPCTGFCFMHGWNFWILNNIGILKIFPVILNLLGVEKNNDQARKNYLSSNHKNAPQEVLRTEARLAILKGMGLERQKRKYNKVNTEYWKNTIYENRRHATETEINDGTT